IAIDQQTIGSDQQDLEEHEQVEQVAGQEGAVDTRQLELEQGVEVRRSAVLAAAGVQRDQRGQRGGEHQHDRAEAVQQQHDAERRLPVAQRVDTQHVVPGQQRQPEGHRQQRGGGQQRQRALEQLAATVQRQQQRTGEERNEDGQDNGVIHAFGSCPST